MQIVQIALASEVKQALDGLKDRARELHAELEADIFREMQEVQINVLSSLPPPILGRPKLLRPEIPRDQVVAINAAIMKHGVGHPRVVKMRADAMAALDAKVEADAAQRAERKVLMSPTAKAKRMREEAAQRRAKVLDENPVLAEKLEAVTKLLTNSSIAADALVVGCAHLRNDLEALFGPKGFTKKTTKK